MVSSRQPITRRDEHTTDVEPGTTPEGHQRNACPVRRVHPSDGDTGNQPGIYGPNGTDKPGRVAGRPRISNSPAPLDSCSGYLDHGQPVGEGKLVRAATRTKRHPFSISPELYGKKTTVERNSR